MKHLYHKKIAAFLSSSFLILFLSSQSNASEYFAKTGSGGAAGSMAEAIKHSEMSLS